MALFYQVIILLKAIPYSKNKHMAIVPLLARKSDRFITVAIVERAITLWGAEK